MKNIDMIVFTGGGRSKFLSEKGFTLAETLVTLGIIGIVTAMTLPSIVQKHQEKVTVSKLKKFIQLFLTPI